MRSSRPGFGVFHHEVAAGDQQPGGGGRCRRRQLHAVRSPAVQRLGGSVPGPLRVRWGQLRPECRAGWRRRRRRCRCVRAARRGESPRMRWTPSGSKLRAAQAWANSLNSTAYTSAPETSCAMEPAIARTRCQDPPLWVRVALQLSITSCTTDSVSGRGMKTPARRQFKVTEVRDAGDVLQRNTPGPARR